MIASEIPFPHQLRPLSYAQQLDRIVTRVLEEESHLLDAQEDWPWIDGFLTFNDNNEAKSDLFRLLNRKPGWLRPTTRAASTSNTAVLVIAPALQSQAPVSSGADWVETQGPNSLEDWLLLLSRPEVYDLARKFKIPIISSSGGGGGVDKMREAILTYSKGSQRTLSFSTSSSSLESLIIAAVRKYESAKHVVRLNPLARDAFHRLLVVANKELEWPEGDKFLVSSILSNLKSLPAAEENEVEDEDEGDGAVLGDCQDLATNETSSFPPSRALRNNQLFFFPYTTSTFSLTFPSRSDLLEYIKYLKLERKMLDLMEITRKSSPSSLSLALDLMHSCIPEWKSLVAKERELVNSGQGCGGHISGIPWMVVYTPVYVLTRILHRGRHLILDMSDSFSSSASLSSSNNKPDRYKALASHLRMLLDQKYFLQSKRGRWFDELTKILHYHLKDLGTAESVCAEALDSVNEPFVLTGFKRTIELRQRRIKKLQTPPRPPPSLKGIVDSIITIHAVKVFSETGKKALYVRNIEDAVEPKPVTVEQLAINYFQDEMLVNNGNSSDSESGKGRWRAVHSENSALPTLFALLFFDIMFLDTIPGVFISPFQTRPLDLSSEFFYISRRAQIEERLAEIRGVDKGDDGEVFIESMIRRVDENERKRRTLCVGLNWDLFSMDDLIEICKCLGGESIAMICECFVKNYSAHSGGMPDLCVWNEKMREIRFVEVKGQGDRFSDKQRVWFDLLKNCGVPVQEFHVITTTPNNNKRKAQD